MRLVHVQSSMRSSWSARSMHVFKKRSTVCEAGICKPRGENSTEAWELISAPETLAYVTDARGRWRVFKFHTRCDIGSGNTPYIATWKCYEFMACYFWTIESPYVPLKRLWPVCNTRNSATAAQIDDLTEIDECDGCFRWLWWVIYLRSAVVDNVKCTEHTTVCLVISDNSWASTPWG